MDGAQILFLAIVFLVAAGIAVAALMMFSPIALRERLSDVVEPTEAAPDPVGGGWVEKVAQAAQPFSRLSLPEQGWERSPLRARFMNAGWRSAAAPSLYFAAKTLLALGLPSALALCGLLTLESAHKLFLYLLLLVAGIGYYLPNAVLSHMAAVRCREIFENFPDALDLLTVCVEAGLSLERALAKVAGEIHIKSMALAQELQLVLMEMRAGFTKERALRNLALRSGVEDVDTLVAMLIQSERFGTSMGDSLRIHSDNLRSKRSVLAEEAAAKIALKLLFPLIFCIFPTLMLVLIGPAGIQVFRMIQAH
ncbi:type II secretion system F family protein [Pseudoduganella sp. FT25W]|jgi:tight adherence protein C|uniref:Type II secretion system F family protein n=1 Tax=Duganella alba TaxID=2666081 RepID=A0A6L5QCH8_9BURK|nr:type II secretion system F family protein [Duganella alba]MRX06801.1 type II secretion system F family protein [Duganella alba]MRX18396.1 type II secretion system F family protein [Duganella alba]